MRKLADLASERGISVSRLAVAWTLANPAVQVAIVGARSARHIEDSVAAAQVSLSDADLKQIEQIVAGAVPMSGPSPEIMPD